MKKLFVKITKRRPRSGSGSLDAGPSGSHAGTIAPAVSVAADRDGLGLIKLAECRTAGSDGDEEQYPVDIIAVHGLNGNAYTTWTHSNGSLWLRDFLPNSLPGCRVFTYGYPSQVFSRSIAEVKGYAQRLLAAAAEMGEGRAIVFVCHSLGGIVCKQALVTAHEDSADPDSQRVLQSVAGVVFLGTPHRGSGTASLGNVVGTVVNGLIRSTSIGLQGRTIRTDLLRHLEFDSSALQELAESVRHRLAGIQIVSFYETEPEPFMSSVVVDKISATLGIPTEKAYPLYASHRDMCRFPLENSEYKAVLGEIRRIAKAAPPPRLAPPKRRSTHSSQVSWDDSEKSCMSLFSKFDVSDYQMRIPPPAKGTCQWILGHPPFVSWLETAGNALLWLTGHPGCGKTILSLYLAKQLSTPSSPGGSRPSKNVCVYFCDDKIGKQKDANNILIGLIFQLVRRHHSLARHVRKLYQMHGHNIVRSFTALWTLFEDMATDPKSGPTIIIIDALDECREDTRRALLNAIKLFARGPERPTSSGAQAHVKFVLTSRPLAEVDRAALDGALEYRIHIDDVRGSHDGDLQIYIRQRLDEISAQRQLRSEMRQSLEALLYSKSGQTFLWVHMVLTDLERSPLLSNNDLKAFIQRIPPSLEMTYVRFVSEIPDEQLEAAAKLLKLILGSTRPLDLDEINMAFSISADRHRSADELRQDCQAGMHSTLTSILGQLVRISDSKVSLVHQSAKEFLLGAHNRAGRGADESKLHPALSAIGEKDCALALATACVSYLLLDDFSEDLFAVTESPKTSDSVSDPSDEASEADGPSSSSSSSGRPFWEDKDEKLDAGYDFFKESGALDQEVCQSLTCQHPFYEYAALYWAEHVAACEASAPQALRDAAKRLLDAGTARCTNWLRFRATVAPAGDESVPENFEPVALAAFFNLREILQELLDTATATPHRRQSDLDVALFWAAEQGHGAIVDALLRAGADPNVQVSDKQTGLVTAAKNGHAECARILLSDARTEINAKGHHGRTALAFACRSGHDDIVGMLLSREGCDANSPGDSGTTPLIWAAVGGHARTVGMLAAHHAVDVNRRDGSGRTAASWAAGDGMTDVLKVLLKQEAVDPNLKDNDGRSPLSWAAGNGRAGAVKLLVRNSKVDKASVDKHLRNAISWACGGGHAEALRVLLANGCPGVDDVDESGWTPLAWAIQIESPDTLRALVSDPRVDIERRDNSGRTALSWAVGYGHLEVVRILLRAGADPRTRSETGLTPVSVAEALGRADILEELRVYLKEE